MPCYTLWRRPRTALAGLVSRDRARPAAPAAPQGAPWETEAATPRRNTCWRGLALLLLLTIFVAPAASQPRPTSPPPDATSRECYQHADAGPSITSLANWANWVLRGPLRDAPATARAVFAPLLDSHRAMTAEVYAELTRLADVTGYEIAYLRLEGPTLVLDLVPRPLIRRVEIKVKQAMFEPLVDEEIQRRLQLRAGAHLPWRAEGRRCALESDVRRIESYLRDEGYFDARATLAATIAPDASVILNVHVELGVAYRLGRITLDRTPVSAITDTELRATFVHRDTCLIWSLCWGRTRFSRSRLQADLQRITELYQRRGFPATRVQSDFDPAVSFNRVTHEVDITIRIDERRQLDVAFEGHNPDMISEEALRRQLTFVSSGSTDDTEAAISAEQLTKYLQTRGYFEAKVTWHRERFEAFDRLLYRLELASPRRVERITFAGNNAISEATLRDAIGTVAYSLWNDVFAEAPAATSAQLSDDLERIKSVYRRSARRHTLVTVRAAPNASALNTAATTAAAVALGDNEQALHVHFDISEGPVSELAELRLEHAETTPAEDRDALCRMAHTLATSLVLRHHPGYTPAHITRAEADGCRLRLNHVPYIEAYLVEFSAELQAKLQDQGRYASKVEVEPEALTPLSWAATLTLRNTSVLRFGPVLLRGNGRTRGDIIRRELGYPTGAPMGADAVTQGAARLRAMGLFDAVRVEFVESAGNTVLPVVVRTEERYDRRVRFDNELGYSRLNGLFYKLTMFAGNLTGRGISLQIPVRLRLDALSCVSGEAGCVRPNILETTLRIPRWLADASLGLAFDTSVTAFWRSLPTPRFGDLVTTGFSLAVSRTLTRPRGPTRAARAVALGLRYDFRRRDHQQESMRTAGPDADQARVPVSSRAGTLTASLEWEQRVDRTGAPAPLSPAAGFRFEASAAIASPYLLGQDTFAKLGLGLQKFWPLGARMVLRHDIRVDHGIPLGGAALLPDVERFTAGGDSTVRGYEEERLATEVVASPVAPFGGLTRLRVLPAAGNARAVASLDGQVKLNDYLATALFVDAGVVTNRWQAVGVRDVRWGIGMALARIDTGFGVIGIEYALPLNPRLGDDPRGRWHFGAAMRF